MSASTPICQKGKSLAMCDSPKSIHELQLKIPQSGGCCSPHRDEIWGGGEKFKSTSYILECPPPPPWGGVTPTASHAAGQVPFRG